MFSLSLNLKHINIISQAQVNLFILQLNFNSKLFRVHRKQDIMSYFRDGQYRETLALIDSEMHEDDIKNLKFLSEPFIPKKLQKKFTSALELFEALEKSHQLSENKVEVLVELLHIIGRVDLAMKLLEDAHLLGHHVAHGKYVNPFYVLLFKLSEELNIQELQSLR